MQIKNLLDNLARFTYYEIEEFRRDEHTLEFKYVSVIKNIICNCTVTENSILVIINNLQEKLKNDKDEVINDLLSINSLRNGLAMINIPDCIVDFEEDKYRLNISLSIKDTEICESGVLNLFNAATELVDKILLTVILLWERKVTGMIDINERICVYPHMDYETQIFYATHIMLDNYSAYMGEYYKGKLYGTPYYRGYPSKANTPSNEGIYLPDDDYIISITDNIYESNNSIIINKNFIITIKELGKILLDKENTNFEIIYRDNKLYIRHLINGYSSVTLNSEIMIIIDNPELGTVLGDRLITEYELTPHFNGYILLFAED